MKERLCLPEEMARPRTEARGGAMVSTELKVQGRCAIEEVFFHGKWLKLKFSWMWGRLTGMIRR